MNVFMNPTLWNAYRHGARRRGGNDMSKKYTALKGECWVMTCELPTVYTQTFAKAVAKLLDHTEASYCVKHLDRCTITRNRR